MNVARGVTIGAIWLLLVSASVDALFAMTGWGSWHMFWALVQPCLAGWLYWQLCTYRHLQKRGRR